MDVTGTYWRANYGEISEALQFRIGPVGSTVWTETFPANQLTDLINVLTGIGSAGIGQLVTGTYLQARRVPNTWHDDVSIEPRSNQFPPSLMRFYNLERPDLIAVLTTLQAAITAGSEPDDWDFSSPPDLALETLPSYLQPEQLSATIDEAITAEDVPGQIATAVDGNRSPFVTDTLPVPPFTMVSTMQTGHGWTASGTGITSNLNDTTDYIIGSQCATVTSNGAGATASLLKTGLTLDMTSKGLMIWLKVTATADAKVSFLSLDLGVDSSFVTRYRYVFPLIEKSPIKINEWAPVYINWASFLGGTISGSPTRSTLTAVRVNLVDNNSGEAVTVRVGGVATFTDTPAAFPNGVISLCFDDSFDVRNSLDYMGIYGYTGTLFPILGDLGTAGCLTTAQLIQYVTARGFEIGAHASDQTHHVDWTPQTDAWVEAELTTLRNWMADNNVPGQSFAWPNGTYSAHLAALAQKYYVFSRTNGTFVDTALTPVPFRLSGQTITASKTLAAAKVHVDNVKAGRGWEKFVFHNIKASSATGNDWLRSDFNALIDYIAAQGVAVVPIGQVPRRMMVG